MTCKKYDIWRQSLTVATVVTVEQLSRVEKYGLTELLAFRLVLNIFTTTRICNAYLFLLQSKTLLFFWRNNVFVVLLGKSSFLNGQRWIKLTIQFFHGRQQNSHQDIYIFVGGGWNNKSDRASGFETLFSNTSISFHLVNQSPVGLFIYSATTCLRVKTPPRLGHLAPALEVVGRHTLPF
jgi:hypothetical protein